MTNKKLLDIDLYAPIIPGCSAGGFCLGLHIDEIDKTALEGFDLTNYPEALIYRSPNLSFWFNEEMLTQICVSGGYKGKLESGLGLGDHIEDFEKQYGPIKEGEEDELIFTNLSGLCIDIDYFLYTKDWETAIPNLPVTAIYIY